MRDLKDMGADEVYFEYESGTKADRSELKKIFRIIKPGDTLIATEISRITRSTKQLCDIVDFVEKNGIRLIVGTFVLDCINGMDAMTEAMIKMMGVFAEMERNITVERIRSGLSNARAKGVRLGRPPLTPAQVPPKILEHYSLYKEKKIKKYEYAKLCGVSRPALDRYLAVLEL
jgi:DNA invertase Pin-like site-specific DNA recombinase